MGGTYSQFFAAVRQRESSNDYTAVNGPGFVGAYQFGEAALIDLGYARRDKNIYDNKISWTGKNGIDSTAEFLANPAIQDQAAAEWWPKIWSYIRSFDLEFYDQQTLNGVKLTKSGMIGGAHLVGIGGLKKFLESGGTVIERDGNGTAITEYIKLFADYDVPDTMLNNLEKSNTAINGGSGRDYLQGFAGEDTLNGKGGNDFLKGGIGNDTLIGGDGFDTAVYDGRAIDYKIERQADGSFTISHVRGAKTDGVDTLRGVEHAKFADKSFNLAVNSVTTQVDFALVVDTTGSMGGYIGAVKAQMANLVDALLQNGEVDARISIVGFKDPGETETILSFTDQDDLAARKAAALAAIGSIGVDGGGDTPEGDNSGLLHSLTGAAGEYRDTAVARRIALFTDAPVKDTELAGQVAALAADLGISVASMTTSTSAIGSLTTVTFEEQDGHIPAPIQIYTILVGFDWSAEESVRAIAEQNGGKFFDANNMSELTQALFAIIGAAPNQAPVITSGDGDFALVEVARGTLDAYTVSATDAGGGSSLVYSLSGGADANAFTIDPLSGQLRFALGADNAPLADADGDDRYEVTVQVSDGLSADSQDVTVVLTGAAPGLFLRGGNGQDDLSGNSGNDFIYGDNGADTLLGRNGDDFLSGGNGSDSLDGGAGADRISGGLGSDALTGGDGPDVFMFGQEEGHDIVTDFDVTADSIVLFDGATIRDAQVDDFDGDGSADLQLTLNNGSSVMLLGVDWLNSVEITYDLATLASIRPTIPDAQIV